MEGRVDRRTAIDVSEPPQNKFSDYSNTETCRSTFTEVHRVPTVDSGLK
jgi:hypothetical protein